MTTHHDQMVARHREVRAKFYPVAAPIVPAWRVAEKKNNARADFVRKEGRDLYDRRHYRSPIGPLLSERHPRHLSKVYEYPIGPRKPRMTADGVVIKPRVSCPRIAQEVAWHYDWSVEELMGNDRSFHLAASRHVMFYLCRKLTSSSLPYIGQTCGGRDHTTVNHGINKIARLIKADSALAKEVEEIRQRLSSLYAVAP